jgi:AcrR family transcriptional regulator
VSEEAPGAGDARARLTRAGVLRSAMAVADARGAEALTIRAIAEHLGVTPMALYHHVANKEDILNGIVDLVFAEIELPPADADWRAALRRRTVSARAVLSRHPWATPLMESRPAPGPATVEHHDAVIATLRRAGFSLQMTAHAYSLLDSYLYGFTLTESARPVDDASAPELAAAIMAQLPAGAYPHFTDLMRYYVEHQQAFADQFEFGLDQILHVIDDLPREQSSGRRRS